MQDILESDWKKYSRKVFQLARDRYYSRIMDRAKKLIADDSQSDCDKDIALCKHIEETDEELEIIFGYLRRSSAKWQFASMVRYGLVTEEEVAEFSDDMKEFLGKLSSVLPE